MRWIADGIIALLWFSPVVVGIAALPADAGDDKVDLAPAIWADYQIYLNNLGSDEAYYAVTEDGLGGAPSGCALTKCLPSAGKAGATREEALKRCEDISPPSRDCVIFAVRDEIVADYEMRDY
ncbi:hypothetical protein [Dongia rigui]|uniref:Uncharacterized protein n=1 Tax=Dongia rigui TaxID=940149 RepID=A0ABU5DWS6_9PROT|nr:hypothetical protein [Dongia rigui]MDY0871678.1 hypothetical protein [Dongia rigui]